MAFTQQRSLSPIDTVTDKRNYITWFVFLLLFNLYSNNVRLHLTRTITLKCTFGLCLQCYSYMCSNIALFEALL